jgi:hemerythrin-like domain-containing protein
MTATATQVMETEHRNIEAVVKALGGVALAIENGLPVDVALLGAAVEFLRLYADKLHHSKEEKLFFPLLVKRGVPPQGCPIGGLTHEHEKGRLLVQALSEQTPAFAQGSPGAKDALLQTLRDLVNLYQNHIWKEDAMVFPMADKVLTAADQEELSKHFAEVDRSIGLESVTRMEQLARSLTTTPAGQAPGASAAQPGNCGCGCTP